jgi:hypothetical protein
LRPLRPVLALLNVDRGVKGEGDMEWRLLLLTGVVYRRPTGGRLCSPGCNEGLDWVGVLEVAGLGLGSFGPVRELGIDLERRSGVERLVFFPGDLARFAESRSQCFQWASWLIKGC